MMENKPAKRCTPSVFSKTYFQQKLSHLFYIFLFILFSLALPLKSHSQDIIVRTTNDSIRAKVIEITTDKIRFRYNNLKESPIQEIHKNNVKQIIYENGSKLNIVYNRYEVPADMIIREKKHA